MAGFKTHITTSTILGVGYGAAGSLVLGVPISTAMLAGGLCSVSGMLPDIDSDTGVPLRESIAFGAAVIPMLLLERFRMMGLDNEMIVLISAIIYLVIRFGVATLIKRYTVHRGMWHSLPACAIMGLLAYLLCSCHDPTARVYKALAVVLGFMSHLLLDELYSIDWKSGRLRLKKSFGTAVKFWSKNPWANVSTYGKLIIVCLLAFGDPIMMSQFEHDHTHENIVQEEQPDESQAKPLNTAREWWSNLIGEGTKIRR